MFPVHRRRATESTIAAVALTALLAACGGGGGGGGATSPAEGGDGTTTPAAEGGEPAGAITVLTWRTDRVEDGSFDEYVAAFKARYPQVTDVRIEGITDYEGEVKTRMNTEDYGDVLAIPNTVTPDQLADFFEPLGTQEEMEAEYRWISDKSFGGLSYGIPVVGNVQGIVYNKKVWEAAGVTEFPRTPDEFLQALQKIKDDGIPVAPLYTNYAAGWTLTAWEYYRGIPSADPDYVNEMTTWDAPWSEGRDHEVIDGLLYDVVAQGLTEADPTTTDWESSKRMLALGEIGAMFLGSWAIPQMQAAAAAAAAEGEDVSPDDIAYMPFPYQKDGTFHATAGGDYNLAVNVHSKNKVTARAWIDWFNHESGFSVTEVGLSPMIDGEQPAALEEFTRQVELVTLNPAPAGQENLFSDIDEESGILVTGPEYRQKIIDDARSGARSKQQVFDDLNAAWAAARAAVG